MTLETHKKELIQLTIEAINLQKKIQSLRQQRSKVLVKKPECPICKVRMKRKGKKGSNTYHKCPKCRGKLELTGLFSSPPNPKSLEERNQFLKRQRQEEGRRKLIRELKGKKYLGFKSFVFGGEYINLDDYDKDGISFLVKKQIEEEKKKQEEKAKQLEQKIEEKKEEEKAKNVS